MSDEPGMYRAMVESVDTVVGLLTRDLDPRTLVIFTSDNGTPGCVAEPGEDPEHMKGTLYEGGVRVPLILNGPGVPRGEVSSVLASLVDIIPTIADAMGCPPPGGLDGVSLLGQDPREWIYTEWFWPNGSGPFGAYEQAIRDEEWKLIRRIDEPDEFYNLTADPEEQSQLDLESLSLEERIALGRLRASIPIDLPSSGIGR